MHGYRFSEFPTNGLTPQGKGVLLHHQQPVIGTNSLEAITRRLPYAYPSDALSYLDYNSPNLWTRNCADGETIDHEPKLLERQ